MTDKTPVPGRIEAPGRGIACMIGGGLLLTMNDAVVKWVSSEFQLGQILVSRPGRPRHHHAGAMLAAGVPYLSALLSG